MQLERFENESKEEYKIRLGMAKVRKQVDLDWSELISLIGLDCSIDKYRHDAYAWVYYDDIMMADTKAISTRILSISDLHVPYHLSLEVYEPYIGKVDVLQINGDILDCSSLSSFTKISRVNPIEEMVVARQFILDLIKMLKPKKVLVNYGNHDIRLGAYLAKNLDTEIQELIPETALEYIFLDGFTHYDRGSMSKTFYEPLCNLIDGVDIEYTQKWYSTIGKTIFCHPKAYSSPILKTAEKAMYWFRNEGFDFTSIVLGHTHKVGEYKIGNTVIYEQGTCCQTDKMIYNDGKLVNSQKQGFVYICQDKNGELIKEHSKLIYLN